MMTRTVQPRMISCYIVSLIALLASDIAFAQQTLSDQCIAETNELATIQAITSTAPTAECTINLDVVDSCTADFEPISGYFMEACQNGGGRFYTTDVTYDCTTLAFGATYNADYTYLSFPACVGTSCTNEELKEYYSNTIHPFMEESFAAKGLTCEVSEKNELSFGNDNEKGMDSSANVFLSCSKTAMMFLMFAIAIVAL